LYGTDAARKRLNKPKQSKSTFAIPFFKLLF
jgi:hypothetical protein